MWVRHFLIAILALMAGPLAAADGLLLAAGAGYRKPVLELLDNFSKASGIRAEASFGNMKQVETQAQQNTDITFIVGDRMFLEPMQLAERYVPLGLGRMVVVVPRGQAITSLKDLTEARFKRIAIPDRTKAVYGKAAATCLQRLGLAQALDAKLLEVATVPQVSTYVATGEVDAGFINLTEALALGGRAGARLDAPASCYDPIELSVGVLKGRGHSVGARAFIDYLATPEARGVLERHGL